MSILVFIERNKILFHVIQLFMSFSLYNLDWIDLKKMTGYLILITYVIIQFFIYFCLSLTVVIHKLKIKNDVFVFLLPLLQHLGDTK